MFKKAFLRLLFFGVLFLLLFSYCGASGVEYSITVNGEEIHGLQGVACATGGLLAAGVAVVGVLALVALVLAGAPWYCWESSRLSSWGCFLFFFQSGWWLAEL